MLNGLKNLSLRCKFFCEGVHKLVLFIFLVFFVFTH